MRPSIEYLKTLKTIPHADTLEGWELKMESPQYRMRFWSGSCISGNGFIDSSCVEFLSQDGWVQCEYFTREDYGTEA